MNRWMSIIWILLALVFTACNSGEHKQHISERTVAVVPKKINTHLFYAGVLQPLKTVVVTSPADGVVEDLMFHYGEKVTAKQPLFTLFSDKFQSDYKTALMQYIKAKTEFNQQRSQLSEADFLHKNQLISDDEFTSKQTNFYTSQLSLVQTEDVLASMLKQLDIKGFNLYALTIRDMDKITQLLREKEGSQKLHIHAPTDGVVLLPIKSDSNEVKKILKGEQVKQGDVLAMVGDVSGFLIAIQANEFDVNQLKVGQSVTVTGVAFPQYVLHGEIASVDRQAQTGQSGVPVFPVEVIVPHVSLEQQQFIHIGMSAKVEIMVENPSTLAVPLQAVVQKQGKAFVNVKHQQQVKMVPVTTGKTTANEVFIQAAIASGDKLVITG